jgi:hypothetical protein
MILNNAIGCLLQAVSDTPAHHVYSYIYRQISDRSICLTKKKSESIDIRSLAQRGPWYPVIEIAIQLIGFVRIDSG